MPKLTMSEAASKAFAAVVADAGGASLHLQVDSRFQHVHLQPRRGAALPIYEGEQHVVPSN